MTNTPNKSNTTSNMNEYHAAESFGSQIRILGADDGRLQPLLDLDLGTTGLKVGSISDDRIVVSGIVQADNLIQAHSKFYAKVRKYLPMLVFMTQGSLEMECGMVFHRREPGTLPVLLLPIYSNVGSALHAPDVDVFNALTNKNIPSEFFKYWQDASMTQSYSGKMLLMCSALEALVKNEEGEKHEKLKAVLGGDLWTELFKPGTGLRNKLAHGDRYDDDQEQCHLPYEDIHRAVMRHFRGVVMHGVDARNYFSDDYVDPQRSSFQISEQNSFWVESEHGKFDILRILQDLKKRPCSTDKPFFTEGSSYSTSPLDGRLKTY